MVAGLAGAVVGGFGASLLTEDNDSWLESGSFTDLVLGFEGPGSPQELKFRASAQQQSPTKEE